MGEVRVPADRQVAGPDPAGRRELPRLGPTIDRALVRALALLKRAAALENAQLGVIRHEVAEAIAEAALEVAEGQWDAEFPIDVFQTGSGTSSNMNMNEVLATLASERLGEPVHPNDQVNASQSSNDMFPSAIHVAAASEISSSLIPALAHLAEVLRQKSAQFDTRGEVGPHPPHGRHAGHPGPGVRRLRRRRRARDRTPRRLPSQGRRAAARRHRRRDGLNAPPGFAGGIIKRLADELGLPLTEARDHFEAQGSRDALVEASGAARTMAVSLYKCATDMRWMGSGPRAGLAEIRIPDLQPGSSIMPGKVNPVIPEAVSQVVAQVIGNDAAVAFGGAAGNFELNVMLPVIARNLLESVRLLAKVSRLFADKCIAGIEADVERCRTYALSSPAIATALNPYIGYEQAAKVVKQPWPKEGPAHRRAGTRPAQTRKRSTGPSTWRP